MASHGIVCSDTLPVDVACSAATLTNGEPACLHDAAGGWYCDVRWHLSLEVSGPAACGTATSDVAGPLNLCSYGLGAATVSMGTTTRFYPGPAGMVTPDVAGIVCISALEQAERCRTWTHAGVWLPGSDAGATVSAGGLAALLRALGG